MDIHIATRTAGDQQGRTRRFQYYLTVDTVEESQLCCEQYGVRITEEGVGSACVPALTLSAERIDRLLTMLVDHRVGPVGLRDVIEDWL